MKRVNDKWRATALLALMISVTAASLRMRAEAQSTGLCGGGDGEATIPFSDVPNTNIFFCSIAAAYFAGLTAGTSATTYSPSANVTREQMAAFISRTLDQSLRWGDRRAARRQWRSYRGVPDTTVVGVGLNPQLLECDGADLWVASEANHQVARVQASSGQLKEIWQGATNAYGVLVARGQIYVTGNTNPGRLWRIDPRFANTPRQAVLEAGNLGAFPRGIAFDGLRIWTANFGGSVSIRSFQPPASTTTVSTGFVAPVGILYDGSDIWVTDAGDNRLKKLNFNGSIALSIPVGSQPFHPVFDGMNIWVPNKLSDSVTAVRVKDSSGNRLSSPFVLQTLSFNGLYAPVCAAFDGQRVLMTNFNGDTVSLWKAADSTPLEISGIPNSLNIRPLGACSDGVNFWVTLNASDVIVRY